MMKRIFALLLAIFGIVLTSCNNGSKQDLESLRKDEPAAEIKANLNINFDEKTGSKKLNTAEQESDSYYDVYVASNTKESLFVYNVSFDEHIDRHLKPAYVNTLTFADSMYADEMSSYIKELNNEDYGVATLDLGFTTIEDLKWTNEISTEQLLPAKKDTNTGIELSIVYMPTYFVRVHKGVEILKVYVFVPVYTEFVSNGKSIVDDKENDYALVDSSLQDIKEVELKFNAEKPTYLASKLIENTTTTTN